MRELFLTSGRGTITTCHEVTFDELRVVEIAVFGGNDLVLTLDCLLTVVEMGHEGSCFDTAETNTQNVNTAIGSIKGETVRISRCLR